MTTQYVPFTFKINFKRTHLLQQKNRHSSCNLSLGKKLEFSAKTKQNCKAFGHNGFIIMGQLDLYTNYNPLICLSILFAILGAKETKCKMKKVQNVTGALFWHNFGADFVRLQQVLQTLFFLIVSVNAKEEKYLQNRFPWIFFQQHVKGASRQIAHLHANSCCYAKYRVKKARACYLAGTRRRREKN